MHEMSSRWVAKYDIIIEDPNEVFMNDITSALLYLEKQHLHKLLGQVQLDLKEAQENKKEEDLNLNMEVYKLLKEKQQELSKKIGAVVLH
jgi:hypothetical protein